MVSIPNSTLPVNHFISQSEGLGKRLAHGYPFLEAEVAYCARYEYCESAVDFVARRCRLAFLDTDAAGRALPRIIDILASEHKWDKARRKLELQKGIEFLETFKSSKNAQFRDGKHNGEFILTYSSCIHPVKLIISCLFLCRAMTENIITVNKRGIVQLHDTCMQLNSQESSLQHGNYSVHVCWVMKSFCFPYLHVGAYHICGQIISSPCLCWIYMVN
jgi:hypothetical protein